MGGSNCKRYCEDFIHSPFSGPSKKIYDEQGNLLSVTKCSICRKKFYGQNTIWCNCCGMKVRTHVRSKTKNAKKLLKRIHL